MLNMPAQPPPPKTFDRDMFTHLDGIQLDEAKSEHILVGADGPESILPMEVRRGAPGQPLAIKTVFGWTLFGVVKNPVLAAHISHLQAVASQAHSSLVQQF